MKDFDVKDVTLSKKGEKKIKWAEEHMPVLMKIRERFSEEKPLAGITVGACLHVTKETAVLVKTLKAGGAEVALTASNPLSTQDDVAAALTNSINVYAWRGETKKEYYQNINRVLDYNPQITLDDGADLVSTLHKERKDQLGKVKGGTEETTTGVVRLKAMAEDGALKYPIIAVNHAQTKWLFDNVYGTGQSALDGVIRATNILIAEKTFVVSGYGHCGKGIAQRARGLGAKVIVTEVDPVKALKAWMDGFQVMPMQQAAEKGDVFITSTGNKNVIRKEHVKKMKDGVILANAGHFNVEINLEDLKELSVERTEVNDNVERFKLEDGRKVYLLAEGRLVNLTAAEGHPSAVMDMSFTNQALCVEYLTKNNLRTKVHKVPEEVDEKVARLKLEALGLKIDHLTNGQKEYLKSWEVGT